MIEKTDVITCKCDNPDKKYLDQRYDNLWVCDRCHHFGGSDTWDNSVNIIRPTNIITKSDEVNMIDPCSHQELQHLEDKIDDFRNAVHDKVLGYGAFGKGVLIGLAVALGILLIMRSLGLYTLNPIVPQASAGVTTPSIIDPGPSPLIIPEPEPAPLPEPESEAPVPLIPLT